MNAKRIFILTCLVLFTAGALSSCTNDTANDDQLYQEQSIDKDEITEEDT